MSALMRKLLSVTYACAGLEAAEHFDARRVAAAELEHAHFVGVADLREHDVEVAKALQR